MEEAIYNSIAALTSNDNAARGAAEAYLLQNLDSNTVPTVQTLMNLLSNPALAMPLRSAAGVLLRRALEAHGNNGKLPDAFIEQLKQVCVQAFGQEASPMLLKRMAHIMAQLATIREWPTLLHTVVNSVSSSPQLANSTVYVTACLNLIEIIADYVPETISSNAQATVALLGPFLGSFMSASDPNTQVSCARATAGLIVALDDENARNAFKPALQPIIKVVGDALQRGDEMEATGILENMVTLVQIQPLFLKGMCMLRLVLSRTNLIHVCAVSCRMCR
jgi:hypothetical protein